MSTQQSKAELFRTLHVTGDPVVLFNTWDPGSTLTVAKAGASAIATGSLPVALAHGYKDGENMPLSIALDNIRRIIDATELPVTMDLESGYGPEPAQVAQTIELAMATGIVGFNFEDQIIGGEGLYGISEQSARVRAARSAADQSGVAGFLNSRTDIFLKTPADQHTDAMVSEAIERASAYQQAGADGFFAPGLADEKFIGRLCNEVELPVNIIALPNVPPKATLARLGVARISYGPVPYRQISTYLTEAAKAAFA